MREPPFLPSRLVVAGVLALLVVGCASYRNRRDRYQSLGEREKIVRAQPGEFIVGGRAAFIRDECEGGASAESPAGETVSTPCRQVSLGGGDVLEQLDRHHYVIKADEGVAVDQATRIIPARRGP